MKQDISFICNLVPSETEVIAFSCLFVFSELREDKCQPQGFLVDGVKALISSLRTWLRREVRDASEMHLSDQYMFSESQTTNRCIASIMFYQLIYLNMYAQCLVMSGSILSVIFCLLISFLCFCSHQLTQPNSEVPDNIRPTHLIKSLTKEIRYLEVWHLFIKKIYRC